MQYMQTKAVFLAKLLSKKAFFCTFLFIFPHRSSKSLYLTDTLGVMILVGRCVPYFRRYGNLTLSRKFGIFWCLWKFITLWTKVKSIIMIRLEGEVYRLLSKFLTMECINSFKNNGMFQISRALRIFKEKLKVDLSRTDVPW